MLKGSMESRISATFGDIIFVTAVGMIFILLAVPRLVLNVNVAGAEAEARTMEYANLAKALLAKEYGSGDGTFSMENASMMRKNGLGYLGLSDNYLLLEDTVSGAYIVFEGNNGKGVHDIFTVASSSYVPVVDESAVVAEKGKEYVIVARKEGESVIMEIREGFACMAVDSRLPGYPDCAALSVVPVAQAGKSEVRDLAILAKNGDAGGSRALWAVMEDDVQAKGVVPGGLKFSGSWECPAEDERELCVRKMGDFAIPVRIHAEMDRDAEFMAGSGG